MGKCWLTPLELLYLIMYLSFFCVHIDTHNKQQDGLLKADFTTLLRCKTCSLILRVFFLQYFTSFFCNDSHISFEAYIFVKMDSLNVSLAVIDGNLLFRFLKGLYHAVVRVKANSKSMRVPLEDRCIFLFKKSGWWLGKGWNASRFLFDCIYERSCLFALVSASPFAYDGSNVDASMKFEDYLQFVLYNSSPF